MKPPVEHVRISSKGKDILIKLKRASGLHQWNEICRFALCTSLANKTQPPKHEKTGESAIDMEWKTFAGPFQEELTALILLRANMDNVDLTSKEAISEYFRCHLERGITSIQNLKSLLSFTNSLNQSTL